MRLPLSVKDTTSDETFAVVATDIDVVYMERDLARPWFGARGEAGISYTEMLYLAYSAGKRAKHWSTDGPVFGMVSKKNAGNSDQFYAWLETHELEFESAADEAVPLAETAEPTS